MTAYFNFFFSLELSRKLHLSAVFLMRLMSNQINKDFEASFNETNQLSISFAVSSMWRIVICILSNIHAVDSEKQIYKKNVKQNGTKY